MDWIKNKLNFVRVILWLGFFGFFCLFFFGFRASLSKTTLQEKYSIPTDVLTDKPSSMDSILFSTGCKTGTAQGMAFSFMEGKPAGCQPGTPEAEILERINNQTDAINNSSTFNYQTQFMHFLTKDMEYTHLTPTHQLIESVVDPGSGGETYLTHFGVEEAVFGPNLMTLMLSIPEIQAKINGSPTLTMLGGGWLWLNFNNHISRFY